MAETCSDHQKYLAGRTGSSPFRIAEIPGAGRGLLATRDIEPGELLFSSLAAVVGPCARSSPQCVTCLKLVQPSAKTQCRKCCLFVCSEVCSAGDDHQVECRIFSLLRAKLKRNKDGERLYRANLSGLTSSVTCVRMLSLKWRDPPTWDLLSTLMSQNINKNVWNDISSVHKNILSLDPRITLADLRQAFGIQSTNGALLHLPPGYGRGLAVYPIQAFLNHSCMCNTTSKEYPQDRVVEIKARFNISAGEEITTSYLRPTQDTQSRRQLLHHTWQFWCECARCRDPTEGGSYLSALSCTSCGSGPMLPLDPLDTETCWVCRECGASITALEQEVLLSKTVQIINSFPKENINYQELEEIIFRLGEIIFPSHWMMMEIKQKLLKVYLDMKNMNRPLKERKIQLCQTIVDYMDKIDPGKDYSKRKLEIMISMLDTKIELMSSDYRNGLLCKERLANAFMARKNLIEMFDSK